MFWNDWSDDIFFEPLHCTLVKLHIIYFMSKMKAKHCCKISFTANNNETFVKACNYDLLLFTLLLFLYNPSSKKVSCHDTNDLKGNRGWKLKISFEHF